MAAHGAHILSMAIYRLFLPLVYVLFIIGLSFSSLTIIRANSCALFWFCLDLDIYRHLVRNQNAHAG